MDNGKISSHCFILQVALFSLRTNQDRRHLIKASLCIYNYDKILGAQRKPTAICS